MKSFFVICCLMTAALLLIFCSDDKTGKSSAYAESASHADELK